MSIASLCIYQFSLSLSFTGKVDYLFLEVYRLVLFFKVKLKIKMVDYLFLNIYGLVLILKVQFKNNIF